MFGFGKEKWFEKKCTECGKRYKTKKEKHTVCVHCARNMNIYGDDFDVEDWIMLDIITDGELDGNFSEESDYSCDCDNPCCGDQGCCDNSCCDDGCDSDCDCG